MLRVSILALFASLLMFQATAFASQNPNQKFDPAMNQPSYWGEDCQKFESPDNVRTWSASRDDVQKIVIKGGTEFEVYESGPFKDLTAALNERSNKTYDISHVVECYGTDEEPEPCEYDATLPKDDPSCEEPKEEPETPSNPDPVEPEVDTPEVLGETTGKGGQAPEILPEAGISAGATMFVGFMFGTTALVVSNLVRDEQSEFDEISL